MVDTAARSEPDLKGLRVFRGQPRCAQLSGLPGAGSTCYGEAGCRAHTAGLDVTGARSCHLEARKEPHQPQAVWAAIKHVPSLHQGLLPSAPRIVLVNQTCVAEKVSEGVETALGRASPASCIGAHLQVSGQPRPDQGLHASQQWLPLVLVMPAGAQREGQAVCRSCCLLWQPGQRLTESSTRPARLV